MLVFPQSRVLGGGRLKAMILAAGLGTRMLPLTMTTPKPLLPVAGLPLLEHHFLHLQAAGFKNVVVNAAHLREQIVSFCGDGSRWDLSITVSCEEEPLETAGGIVTALPLLGDAPFLVVNGDIWCPYPFQTLRSVNPPASGAHLVLVPNPSHNHRGDFGLSNGRVMADGSPTRTFSGIAVYCPGFFAAQGPGRVPLKPLLDAAVSRGGITGNLYRGPWVDVGTPERLEALNRQLSDGSP